MLTKGATAKALQKAAALQHITEGELLDKIINDWLTVQGLPVDEQIKSILTDLLDDAGSKESLDGAVVRIMALQK